jgi:hypothetical protein
MAAERLDLSLRALIGQVLATVRDPRGGARRVIGFGIPTARLWEVLILLVAISVILGQGTILLLMHGTQMTSPVLFHPIVMGIVQLVLLAIMASAIERVGRMFGGEGGFNGALAVVVWLQFVMVCLQVVQTVTLFIYPPIAEIIGIIGLLLFLWLATNFIAELHGFASLGKVFGMLLVSTIVIALVLSLILSALGVVVVETPNV